MGILDTRAGNAQVLATLALAATIGWVGEARAGNDFLMFGEINGGIQDGGEAEYEPLASFFYSHQGDRFRAIAEFVYAPKEKELERLQFGVPIGEGTAWVGRFHVPVGYVNSVLHHGSFLETSITRGHAWAYEDEGGVIPMHVSGLMLEDDRPLRGGALQYHLALGAGPTVTPHGLEPVDLLDPSFHGSGAFTVRASYSWDGLGESVAGGYLARFDMPVELSGGRLEQQLVGAFLNVVGDVWTTRADAVLVQVSGEGAHDRFANAYLQMERNFSDRLTGFARGEATVYGGHNAYLERFPDFIRREVLVGLRYDFSRNACGKLQFGRGTTVAGETGNSINAQLCLMFSR